MFVDILYFAAVRDAVGIGSERVEVPSRVRTAGELARHLAVLHPALQGRLGSVRLALNEVFVRDDDAVADGDVMALIPPVAGG